MKEKPILFSGEMVRAILEGRKTQTRRAISPQPARTEIGWEWKPETLARGWNDNPSDVYQKQSLASLALACECPYGQPGDRLWVKETWRAPSNWDDTPPNRLPHCLADDLCYLATDNHLSGKTRVSIHMPRHFSRITLELTAVRVERVQDISGEDARREGTAGEYSFSQLWDSINAKRDEGKYSWASNPWVWVLEFKGL